MKKIIEKIKLYFKNNKIFNEENILSFVEYLIPENLNEMKKSYILFWFIAAFSIIFLIWASIAEVNQVVRAQGSVRPDSKVHLIQTAITGPVEEIRTSLGDEVNSGEVLFVVDHKSATDLFNLVDSEVQTRSRKVKILEDLVNKGSDSEFRLLDERLLLIEAEKRYETAKRKLDFSFVSSPISGSVSKVNVDNVGQIVKEGTLLAEIVPEDDTLKIEAGVNSKDIAYVKSGQKAKISFTAYDVAIYGMVDGIVTKVAANTTVNEEGVSYYPAIIEVDAKSIEEKQDIIVQSGMVCDVSIIGEERTVLSYIMNPITKLSMRALQE